MPRNVTNLFMTKTITHVPMAVHKEARDILVIGAGDGGVVRTDQI